MKNSMLLVCCGVDFSLLIFALLWPIRRSMMQPWSTTDLQVVGLISAWILFQVVYLIVPVVRSHAQKKEGEKI